MPTVQTIIDDIQVETQTDLSDANLLVMFKSGMRRMSAFIPHRTFLNVGTLTMAASAQTVSLLSLSPDPIEERHVWYEKDNARVTINRPQTMDYYHEVYTNTGSGKPDYYRIYGTTLEVNKPADEALTIGLDYLGEISGISLSSTFVGDERIIQAAMYLCKAEYYGDYEEDENKAARNDKKAKEILMQLERDYEIHELGGTVAHTELDFY